MIFFGQLAYNAAANAFSGLTGILIFTGANVDIGNAALKYDFLALVNEARRAEGLNELQWVPSDAAEEFTLLRAHELIGNYSHDRTLATGLEVIDCGATSVSQTFQSWMNSPVHRQILMSENVKYLSAAMERNYWIIIVWNEKFDLPGVEWWATNNYNEFS